jgi:hypothetical protein
MDFVIAQVAILRGDILVPRRATRAASFAGITAETSTKTRPF